jgi:hypothetical protein
VRPRWHLAGLALSGAMLMHELAALFYPAALIAVYVNKRSKQKVKFALGMSAVAWGMTVAVYFTFASLTRGISQPLDVIGWAVSNQSGVSPSPNPLPGILMMPRANIDLIFGHRFSFFFSRAGWPDYLLIGLVLALTCAFILIAGRSISFPRLKESLSRISPEMSEMWKQAMAVIIAWVIPYIVFFVFWEPWMLYYRIFYVPPIMLLFGILLANYNFVAYKTGKTPSGAAALLVIIIALFNLVFFIAPGMRADSNTLVAAARGAGDLWNDRTIVYFAKHNSADTAFEYFNDQTEWRRLTPDLLSRLPDEIELIHKQGGNVWFNKGALELNGPDRLKLGEEIKVEVDYAPARYAEVLPPNR